MCIGLLNKEIIWDFELAIVVNGELKDQPDLILSLQVCMNLHVHAYSKSKIKP